MSKVTDINWYRMLKAAGNARADLMRRIRQRRALARQGRV